MSEYDERTIPVTLDNLDYESSVLGGLTYKELIATIIISFVISLFFTVPIAHFVLGNVLFSFVLSVIFTVIFTNRFMKKIYILKKDRPSYMVWIAMQKKIQNDGVKGVRIPMGFVKTTYWHTGIKKD